MGHNYIGTEHLLLGVLEDEERAGVATLTGLGVTPSRARQWLLAKLKRIGEEKQATG
jgi:ATP-dependent Clp protease ATP-binding subunit ClpA